MLKNAPTGLLIKTATGALYEFGPPDGDGWRTVVNCELPRKARFLHQKVRITGPTGIIDGRRYDLDTQDIGVGLFAVFEVPNFSLGPIQTTRRLVIATLTEITTIGSTRAVNQ